MVWGGGGDWFKVVREPKKTLVKENIKDRRTLNTEIINGTLHIEDHSFNKYLLRAHHARYCVK